MTGGWVGGSSGGRNPCCSHSPGIVCPHCAPYHTHAIQIAVGGHMGSHTHTVSQLPEPDPSGVLVAMLRSRLRMDPYKSFPFRAMHFVDTGEHVHLFIVPDKDPVVLTDESHLYPSDQLMTQIRLLLT